MESVGIRAVGGYYDEEVGVLAEGYSGGKVPGKAYCWSSGESGVLYLDAFEAPVDGDHFAASYMMTQDGDGKVGVSRAGLPEGWTYERVSESEFRLSDDGTPPQVSTWTRDEAGDFILWRAS